MGGPGSGSRYRLDRKTTLEDVKHIDVRALQKSKLLKLGMTGSFQWTRKELPPIRIQFSYQQDYLKLSYRHKADDDWQLYEGFIRFDRTPCNYGGERLWFLCPCCSRRVALVYFYRASIQCRHCHNLPYLSQQEGRINRAISRKHKLGARTFEHYDHGEGWGKPKGIHWKTFNRLKERYWRSEMAAINEISSYLERTKESF